MIVLMSQPARKWDNISILWKRILFNNLLLLNCYSFGCSLGDAHQTIEVEILLNALVFSVKCCLKRTKINKKWSDLAYKNILTATYTHFVGNNFIYFISVHEQKAWAGHIGHSALLLDLRGRRRNFSFQVSGWATVLLKQFYHRTFRAVVVVKWSACSHYTPTIRVRILRKPTIFLKNLWW